MQRGIVRTLCERATPRPPSHPPPWHLLGVDIEEEIVYKNPYYKKAVDVETDNSLSEIDVSAARRKDLKAKYVQECRKTYGGAATTAYGLPLAWDDEPAPEQTANATGAVDG